MVGKPGSSLDGLDVKWTVVGPTRHTPRKVRVADIGIVNVHTASHVHRMMLQAAWTLDALEDEDIDPALGDELVKVLTQMLQDTTTDVGSTLGMMLFLSGRRRILPIFTTSSRESYELTPYWTSWNLTSRTYLAPQIEADIQSVSIGGQGVHHKHRPAQIAANRPRSGTSEAPWNFMVSKVEAVLQKPSC